MPRFPDELIKVVNFFNKKAAVGEFKICDSASYLQDNEDIVKPQRLGYDDVGYCFAETLAYIANLEDGNIVFSENDNVWKLLRCKIRCFFQESFITY